MQRQNPPTTSVASRVKAWLSPSLNAAPDSTEQPTTRGDGDTESTTEPPLIDYAIDWDADTQGRIHVTLPQWRQYGSSLEFHIFEWGDDVNGHVQISYVKSIHRNGQSTRIFRDADVVAALQGRRDVIVTW
ncbi:hypothetical protein [Haladaptatus sp. DJG-WS-42]|uniref:hypothetical protein n=1 Tax=Haladaptatus sp. DJG-WS-42 TaxID=3120516 RepID=UPI0030D2D7B4